jgi:hypothetical protein
MFVKKTISLGGRMIAINKSALLAASTRCFSSIELINRSGQKLAKSLEKEIKYENDNYT